MKLAKKGWICLKINCQLKRFDLVANRFVIMAIKKIKISLFGASSWRPFIFSK